MENPAQRSPSRFKVAREECAGGVSVLHLEGSLRWPVGPELRQRVAALVGRAERTIVLDLAHMTAIDAAGVGALVEARALAGAAGAELWIDNPSTKARALLERARLYELLSLDAVFEYEQCS